CSISSSLSPVIGPVEIALTTCPLKGLVQSVRSVQPRGGRRLDACGGAHYERCQPPPKARGISENDRSAAYAAGPLLPGPRSDAPGLLGAAGLRHTPALRHGGRRRHLPSSHDAACARAAPVEGGLCAA